MTGEAAFDTWLETLQARVLDSRQMLENITHLLQEVQIDYVPSAREFRERLAMYYRIVNPDRIDTVDAVLEKYRGREASLFETAAA